MISLSDVGMSYGDRILFSGVTLQLESGHSYGLVGANGSGKTTLLRILSGELPPSAGTVSAPRRLRIGTLRQDQFLYEDERVLDVALMGNEELWTAIAAKTALLEAPKDAFDVDRFTELEETIQRHDGYAAEARAASILEGLGLPAEVHGRPMSTLSGGFKLRVLLARTLAAAPDVLLLDEPTNHLDILSIRWLEKFLRDFAGPVVVISHDHRFLDNVATRILDVDYETVTEYPGNYTQFTESKRAERERREKEIAEREREIAHHQEFVDRFRAKASKARQAQSKLRLIEKRAEGLEELPRSSRRYPRFRFESRRHSGREVLELAGIRKSFGKTEVLHGVDLDVRRGERVAIMGPNGIGKSTLLKIAVGEIQADSGRVEWGYEAHPGYFAQDHHEQFERPDLTAEEWIATYCDRPSIGFVRGELGRVLFSGDDAEKRVGDLSGGEAARLVFARLAIERPNVLVLDEPTNHLDLEAIEALVDALRDYDGTLIFVSHDRWFVSKLADRVVEITATGLRDFSGTYEEYVHACGDDHLDADTVVLKARRAKRADRGTDEQATERAAEGRKSAEAERRKSAGPEAVRGLRDRRDEVTRRIEELEDRLAAIDGMFADPATYDDSNADRLAQLEAERSRLAAELEHRIAEWEAVETELAGLEDAVSPGSAPR